MSRDKGEDRRGRGESVSRDKGEDRDSIYTLFTLKNKILHLKTPNGG